MVKLAGLKAQDIVAKLMQEYTSLNFFFFKQNSLNNKMLVFVFRSVEYAKRADVKLSVHRSFTFFCHLAHAFYLRAYVLFALSFCS